MKRKKKEIATELTRLTATAPPPAPPIAAPEVAAVTEEEEAATRGPWQASQVGARGLFTSVQASQAHPTSEKGSAAAAAAAAAGAGVEAGAGLAAIRVSGGVGIRIAAFLPLDVDWARTGLWVASAVRAALGVRLAAGEDVGTVAAFG